MAEKAKEKEVLKPLEVAPKEEKVAEPKEETKVVEPKAEAKAVEPKAIVVKDKFVKVTPKFNGQRFIGGSWLDFEKDKEVEVSLDAKRSLLEAGAIYL